MLSLSSFIVVFQHLHFRQVAGQFVARERARSLLANGI